MPQDDALQAEDADAVSRGEAAARFGVSVSTIDRARRRDQLEWIRVGRTIRVLVPRRLRPTGTNGPDC